MRLILIGFGTVGQGLAQILQDKAADLKKRQGFEGRIVGVATGSRGILYHDDGLSPADLLAAIDKGSFDHYPNSVGLHRYNDVVQMIQAATADVLVEASPTHLDSGQPALSYMEAALQSGKHVVTANKGPIARDLSHLQAMAADNQVQVRFEATVMAGTPAVATGIDLLSGCTISEARGILNGTTNYILTQMEEGLSYEKALKQAQTLGYAETDPTADVEGWDAAAKVLILLSALFGQQTAQSDLSVTGITAITQADIEAAKKSGERYKLIASANATGGRVQAMRLPLSDPLAQIGGATNAITFSTDLMGDITLIGAGAGKLETGYALLADLLAIHRQQCV
ncbi:MAG: homoserine dehydrogenase [Anaerolineae bacterium]|nr:homoserine dehydrogenase [Anaerolineae bacterium]